MVYMVSPLLLFLLYDSVRYMSKSTVVASAGFWVSVRDPCK